MTSSKFARNQKIQGEPAICRKPPAKPTPITPPTPATPCSMCNVGTTPKSVYLTLAGFTGIHATLNGSYVATQTPANPCTMTVACNDNGLAALLVATNYKSQNSVEIQTPYGGGVGWGKTVATAPRDCKTSWPAGTYTRSILFPWRTYGLATCIVTTFT
jgi:hypothetical protein